MKRCGCLFPLIGFLLLVVLVAFMASKASSAFEGGVMNVGGFLSSDVTPPGGGEEVEDGDQSGSGFEPLPEGCVWWVGSYGELIAIPAEYIGNSEMADGQYNDHYCYAHCGQEFYYYPEFLILCPFCGEPVGADDRGYEGTYVNRGSFLFSGVVDGEDCLTVKDVHSYVSELPICEYDVLYFVVENGAIYALQYQTSSDNDLLIAKGTWDDSSKLLSDAESLVGLEIWLMTRY